MCGVRRRGSIKPFDIQAAPSRAAIGRQEFFAALSLIVAPVRHRMRSDQEVKDFTRQIVDSFPTKSIAMVLSILQRTHYMSRENHRKLKRDVRSTDERTAVA
jgi:hypothetical protein